jgi:hypothetical protein
MLAASQFMLVSGRTDIHVVLAAITLFFSGFNIMEASLPSLITKAAPAAAKGTATGIYSSSQFLGIFAGGTAGGWIYQHTGLGNVFAWSGGLALLWLLLALTMKQPSYLTTRLLRVGDRQAVDALLLAVRLRQIPGVAEAVVIAEERLAYLKVDSRVFNAASARSVVDAEV